MSKFFIVKITNRFIKYKYYSNYCLVASLNIPLKNIYLTKFTRSIHLCTATRFYLYSKFFDYILCTIFRFLMWILLFALFITWTLMFVTEKIDSFSRTSSVVNKLHSTSARLLRFGCKSLRHDDLKSV